MFDLGEVVVLNSSPDVSMTVVGSGTHEVATIWFEPDGRLRRETFPIQALTLAAEVGFKGTSRPQT